MSCDEALSLFDGYHEALISYHEARDCFPGSSDTETCFEALRQARAVYRHHVEAHGCRTARIGVLNESS